MLSRPRSVWTIFDMDTIKVSSCVEFSAEDRKCRDLGSEITAETPPSSVWTSLIPNRIKLVKITQMLSRVP